MKQISFRFRVYILVLLSVVCLGTLGISLAEGMHPFDAFYFLIVTVATVGYGDIHPVTVPGKILTLAIIITGVGCFIGVAANSIESMIDERERRSRFEKLNMIIGLFFSEVGTKLLKIMSSCDPAAAEIRSALVVSNNWTDADFSKARTVIEKHSYTLDSCAVPMDSLYQFLKEKKGFLLMILENPQLIEHESFTPLLQALYHLAEEMMARGSFCSLPSADCAHLSGDLNRVYRLLILEWLTYMQYLKHNYPYLFSLAMRQNPFDENASVVIR